MKDYSNIDSMAIAEAVANKREDLFSTESYDRITNSIYDAWDEGKTTGDEPNYEYRKSHVEVELNQLPEDWEDLINSYKG